MQGEAPLPKTLKQVCLSRFEHFLRQPALCHLCGTRPCQAELLWLLQKSHFVPCFCMIREQHLCTISQQPQICCRMSAPCHLMMCLQDNARSFICLEPAVLCWTLYLVPSHFCAMKKKNQNCKFLPLPLSVLFVIHTTFQQTSPSSILSPFNLSLYRSCYIFCNSAFHSFNDSVPFPQFPLRQGTWRCTHRVQMMCQDLHSSMALFSTLFSLPTVPPIAFLAVAELTVGAEQEEIETLSHPFKNTQHSILHFCQLFISDRSDRTGVMLLN